MVKGKRRHIYINLLKKDTTKRRNLMILTTGGLVFILLVSVMVYAYWWEKSQIQSQLALRQQLNEQIDNQQIEYISLQEQVRVKDLLAEKQKKVEIIEAGKKSYLDILLAINKALPKSIVLNSIEINADNVHLNGYAPNHSQVAIFLEFLRQGAFFENVSLITSGYDEKTREGNFVIEMSWGGKS